MNGEAQAAAANPSGNVGDGTPSEAATAGLSEDTLADWMIVLICTVGLTVSMIYLYSLGAFIIPVSEDLGLSRGETSAGLTLVSLVSVVAAPFVGFSIDRLGSRWIAIVGCIVFCLGITLLSQAQSFFSWFATWAIVAAGSVLMKPTVWMSAVARRINRRRGLAMGVALTGTGISSAISPIIADGAIDAWGWRAAFAILGIGAALILLPLLILFFRDTKVSTPSAERSKPPELSGLTIRQGFRSSEFVRLVIAGFLVNFSVMALVVHFVPLLRGYDFEASDAAKMAGLIGITTILGRLVTGSLMDRFHGPLIGAIGFSLPILACSMLIFFDGSTAMAAAVAVLIGASVGAEVDVLAYLSSRYFGMRRFGTLFGTITGGISLGIGFGPTVAGAIHDSFGSYQPMFFLIMPLVAVSVVLVGTLGAYPQHDAVRSSGANR